MFLYNFNTFNVHTKKKLIMEISEMSLEDLNQQLKQSLKVMKESLKVVETSKKQTSEGNFFSKDQNNNKFLTLTLENDRLTAKNCMLEQEIASLKSQMTAAKLSHKEAETVFNKVTEDNRKLKEALNILQSALSQQKYELNELHQNKSKYFNLMNRVLQVNIKLGSEFDRFASEKKELEEEIERLKQRPCTIAFENVNPKDLIIDLPGNNNIIEKCKKISNSEQYPIFQRFQWIINELTDKINDDTKQISKNEHEIDDLKNKSKELQDENKNLTFHLSAISQNIKSIEGKSNIQLDKDFLSLIQKYKGERYLTEQEILNKLKEDSDYYDIYQSIVFSNSFLKNQLDAVNRALDRKDEFASVCNQLECSSPNEILDIVNHLQNKIDKLKEERKFAYQTLLESKEEFEEIQKVIAQKDHQINVINQEKEELLDKINFLEEQIEENNLSIIKEKECITNEHSDNVNKIKEEYENIIKTKDDEIKKLKEQIQINERKIEESVKQISEEHQKQNQIYEKQIELLQNSYKELTIDSINKDKLFKETLKCLKKQYRADMNDLVETNKAQRQTFDEAVEQMKKRSEQDKELTDKLAQSLRESENKSRELYNYIQTLEENKVKA